MTPRELRREMKARRKELRRSVAAVREQARAQAGQNPQVRREKRRRRVRRALMLWGVLLLLLLLRCDCGTPPMPEIAAAPDAGEKEATPVPKPPAAKAKRPRLNAKTESRPRASYEELMQPAPTWLDDFRLQVAARSARLSQCFAGSDRPGALRWSTSVNPENGAVSQHELEPIGQAGELRGEQQACVLAALSNPTYRLREEQKQGLPKRISLVIEF